jgi:hypothetical protein
MDALSVSLSLCPPLRVYGYTFRLFLLHMRHVLLKRQVAERSLSLCPPLFPLSLSLCLFVRLPLSVRLSERSLFVCPPLFLSLSLSLSVSLSLSLSLSPSRDTDKGGTEPMHALGVFFCDICDTCS